MAKKTKKTLYGDTIVEAVVAIAIYSIVAVLALSSMSSGLSTAQRNLESTMSRTAIDSQSDALRYYYESYIAAKSGKKDDAFYDDIWKEISPKGSNVDPVSLDDASERSCQGLIEADRLKLLEVEENKRGKIFALSGRGALSSAVGLDNKTVYGFGSDEMNQNSYINYQIIGDGRISAAPLYPRITYSTMDGSGNVHSSETGAMDILNSDGDSDGNRQSRVAKAAEGVWIFPKKTDKGYDFFVRTCWNPVGSKSPSTFTSVVRLYNAD